MGLLPRSPVSPAPFYIVAIELLVLVVLSGVCGLFGALLRAKREGKPVLGTLRKSFPAILLGTAVGAVLGLVILRVYIGVIGLTKDAIHGLDIIYTLYSILDYSIPGAIWIGVSGCCAFLFGLLGLYPPASASQSGRQD